MAWALWSGGTLARQRGRLTVAVRWLTAGRALVQHAGELHAYGYAAAGIAETLRIQGGHERARELHEQLFDEARNEPRHIVWALEELAQTDRSTGDLVSAWRLFEEASRTAESAGAERGHAWALRGLADITSLRGDYRKALLLLSQAERICRDMDLASALACNRKMRGNVLFRVGWYDEAARIYQDAEQKFQNIGETRGIALARLGWLKSAHRLGRSCPESIEDIRGCGIRWRATNSATPGRWWRTCWVG